MEKKLEGLEVDLKGETQVVRYLPGLDLKDEAIGQIRKECQSDLKGESEKGQTKPLFLTADGVVRWVKTRGSYNSSPY